MQIVLQFVEKYFIFMLVLFLISYLVPRESYQKYFHFFIGALMVAVLMEPLLSFRSQKVREEFHSEMRKIEQELSDMEYYEKGEDIFEQFLEDPGLAGNQDEEEE